MGVQEESVSRFSSFFCSSSLFLYRTTSHRFIITVTLPFSIYEQWEEIQRNHFLYKSNSIIFFLFFPPSSVLSLCSSFFFSSFERA